MIPAVVPSRVVSNLRACLDALGDRPVCAVDDGLDERPEGPTYVSGMKPFVFARNANIGLRRAFEAADAAMLVNDDARLLTPGGIEALDAEARGKGYGVVSAAITGAVGNRRQRPSGVGLREEKGTLAFVAVWLPRSTWEAVGELDERFVDYGGEDNDYCHRVKLAGLKLGIFDGCVFEHGVLASTFRGHGSRDVSVAYRLLDGKWGRAWRQG
jgi:GT2 family glycosyltransferase